MRELGFASGPSLSAAVVDLFVGADGARSALCAALNPDLVRVRSRVFSSQGVGSALEDAVVLAGAIARTHGRRDLLPQALAGFCEERRRDVGRFVDGGRLILSHFVGASGLVAPYVYAGPRPPQRWRTTRLPS